MDLKSIQDKLNEEFKYKKYFELAWVAHRNCEGVTNPYPENINFSKYTKKK